ncbi:MAG: YtxH domain-containing protein [Bacteroidia bacterium]
MWKLIRRNMKDNDNSKLLLALLGGVAIGVAIGYFLNSDKKDEIVDNLKEKASKLKEDLSEEIDKGKSIIEDLKNSVEEHFKKSSI